jgi:hypothetical protein
MGLAHVAGERALGELEHERSGGQCRCPERGGNGVEETGIRQLLGSQIDAHVEAVVDHAGASPGTYLRCCLADRPATDGDDETGGLEQVDELARPDETPHRVAPAEQRLHPCRCASGRLDYRLVVQLELVAGERLPQLFERRRGRVDLRGPAVISHRRGLHVDSLLPGARNVPLLACSWRGVSADFRPR